jgi:hypothetical protein
MPAQPRRLHIRPSAVTFPERSGRSVSLVRRRSRLRVSAATWLIAGVAVLMVVAAWLLTGLNASELSAGRIGWPGILGLAVFEYAGTGRLIASRLPRNPIGWLLGLMGLSLAGVALTEQYALYGLVTAPGSLPAARLAGWSSDLLILLAIMLLYFLVLLFPDGRLPSRRWRPVLWAVCAVTAGSIAQQLQAGIVTGPSNALAAAKASYPNPVGIFPEHGWFSRVLGVIFVMAVITALLVIASVLARRRGASPELRKQLAWLGYVGLLTAVWALVLVVATLMHAEGSWAATAAWLLLELTPVVGIPLACAVAVLKYRLYDIDRIISRTLAYTIVTGLLVGVYAGLVLLATRVLSFHSAVAVAASTLAAAALFSPLRRRVQQAVDRRFNRARYDADQTVAVFAARLKDTVDMDSVRDDLASVVHQTLEPAHVSVWINRPG